MVRSNTSDEIFNHSNALRLYSGCGQRSESCLLTVSLSPLLHSWALPGPGPILLFLTSCPDAASNSLPHLAKGAREAGRWSADSPTHPVPRFHPQMCSRTLAVAPSLSVSVSSRWLRSPTASSLTNPSLCLSLQFLRHSRNPRDSWPPLQPERDSQQSC